MRCRARPDEGWTFVELLVVLGVSLLLAGSFYTMFLASGSASATGLTAIEVSENARIGMDRMIRELRNARQATVSIPASGEVTFQVPGNVNSIRYALGGATGTQLIRTENGASTVFCNNVQSLQLSPTPFSGRVITIALQVQKTAPSRHVVGHTYRGRLRVRN